ncbi:MAG TPA: hypothetical protein VIJ95_08320 [Hanamia sp.]
MNGSKITAVIPIRKGSQRVIDKNLRKFANKTLLELKIETLKCVTEIDEIIVNTDSEKAIAIAKEHNVSYHRRTPYYASSECSGSEYFEHLGRVTDTDIFAYCPVTSPFIEIGTIKKCICEFKNNDKCDSLATVSLIKEFLWLNNEPINYKREEAPNSQNLPDILALNFGFSLIEKSDLIKNKNIIGQKPHFVITNDIESIDIDTPLDFYIAEQIYIKTILNKLDILY